jgi:hypothetical protein
VSTPNSNAAGDSFTSPLYRLPFAVVQARPAAADKTRVNLAPTPPGSLSQDDTKIHQLREKRDDNRTLTPAELYRALNDAIDEGYDLFDLSNREARFALILMGGLNAALVIAATQTSLLAQLSSAERQMVGSVVGLYAIFALGFVLQAVHALRPGQYHPDFKRWSRERKDFPKGVRYFEDVVSRETEQHWEAWKTVTLRQLNAELAVQLHSLSLKNDARKKALRALYTNLRIMTVVLSLILILFVIFTLS